MEHDAAADPGTATALVVGIAGGSASGKSTLTTGLATALSDAGWRVRTLATDPFMHHDAERGPVFHSSTTGELTFDCNQPESVDWPLLLAELDQRRAAADVLLVEGLMVLHVPEVRERLDVRLFVELDADERALRRMVRDLAAPRGLTEPAAIAAYYRESARLGHSRFVEPSRAFADLIVRGDGELGRIVPLLVAALTGRPPTRH